MNVATLPSAVISGTTPVTPSADEQKVADSCRQFEAVLWRQLLDGAMQPLLAKPPGAAGGGNGVYQFFFSNTLAESVSGRPDGFSSLLQAQIAGGAESRALSND